MAPMIARRQKPALKLGIPVLVFAVLLGAFTLANHSGGPTSAASGEAQPAAGLGRPARNTEELIEDLQRQVRAEPDKAAGYASRSPRRRSSWGYSCSHAAELGMTKTARGAGATTVATDHHRIDG